MLKIEPRFVFLHLKKACLFLILFFGIFFVLFQYYSTSLSLLRVVNNKLIISDFAYYVLIVRAFWFENLDSLYNVASHQGVLQKATGEQIMSVMPLAISPIFAVVLFPFSWLAKYSIEMSQAAWGSTSLVIFIGAVIDVFNTLKKKRRLLHYWWALFILCSVVSFEFLFTVGLGQTSIMATSLFLFLVLCLEDETQPLKMRQILLIAFILALKPTYLVLFLMTMILYKKIREVVFVLGFLAVVLLLLCMKMGFLWGGEYGEMFRAFSMDNIEPVYLSAFGFEKMIIFRSVVSSVLGTKSGIVLSYGALSIIWGSLLGGALWYPSSSLQRWRLAFISVLFGSYLLFAPYVGTYEDLLLLVLVASFLLQTSVYRVGFQTPMIEYLLIVVSLIGVFNHLLLLPVISLFIFWIMKCVLVLVCARGAVNS